MQVNREKFDAIRNLLDPTEEIELEKILKYEDKEGLTNWMYKFVNDLGDISYEGGLLTLAQINKRKMYPIDATALKEDEVIDYFKRLQNTPPPVREKFIIFGEHTISGEISIDKNKNVNLLLLDPLGFELTNENQITNLNPDAQRILFQYAKLFPHSNIYMDPTKIQNTFTGCYVFALSHIRHLHMVEQYLPDQYKELGLFDYLDKKTVSNACLNAVPTDEQEQPPAIQIQMTHLPLTLMRSAQTSSLLTHVIPVREKDEQSTAVNKRGETAIEASRKHFIVNIKSGKPENKRLKYELEKIAKYNFEYLIATPKNVIEEEMNQFTLDSFQKKMDQRTSEQKTTPGPSPRKSKS